MHHHHRFLVVSLVLSLAVFGASCSSKKVTTNASPANTVSTGVTTQNVQIMNMGFSPIDLTILKGQTVIWTNNDSVGHTVTGDNGGPASGTIADGGTYSYTFNTAGTFAYHCAIHPTMIGSISVVE